MLHWQKLATMSAPSAATALRLTPKSTEYTNVQQPMLFDWSTCEHAEEAISKGRMHHRGWIANPVEEVVAHQNSAEDGTFFHYVEGCPVQVPL